MEEEIVKGNVLENKWYGTKRVVAIIILLLSVLNPSYASERIEDSNRATIRAEDIFFGRLWGMEPDKFKGAKFITDLDSNFMIYSVDLDVSSIVGAVPTYSCLQLLFSRNEGLVQANISFAGQEYNKVEEGLERLLGKPSPIIYDMMVSRKGVLKDNQWFVGPNTRVTLELGVMDASIEISKRTFPLVRGETMREKIALAMLKQAERYSREGQILKASSVYQTLLNSTDSYQFFTQTAQEHLVLYSGLHAAVEYLGAEQGFAFYGFQNSLLDGGGQQWLRIDLDDAAREELKRQGPSDVQNELAMISMVLCRVRTDPTIGEIIIVEQIWVDDSNRIIGGRSAWASQNTGWPVSYINQTCEIFLRKWFNIANKQEV